MSLWGSVGTALRGTQHALSKSVLRCLTQQLKVSHTIEPL